MKNKVMQTTFRLLAVVVIAVSLVLLTSCKDGDIYSFISDMSNISASETDSFSFDASITCEIDMELLKAIGVAFPYIESLDVIPYEMTIKLNGNARKEPFEMAADIIIDDYSDTAATIYIKDNELFFELNDSSRIITDILSASGMVGGTVLDLFRQKIDYDSGMILCFDITDFDLSYFEDYISYAEKIISVDSTVEYGDGEDFEVPARDESKTVYFNDIKNQIGKELLSRPGYRYSKLICVVSTENGENYLDVIGVREGEGGEYVRLDKVKIASDLSAVRKYPELFPAAEILPLRYIFEMLGKVVEWDEGTQTAYVSDDSFEVQVNGKLIGDRMYMGISNVKFFDYSYDITSIGEYIEFTIYKNEDVS